VACLQSVHSLRVKCRQLARLIEFSFKVRHSPDALSGNPGESGLDRRLNRCDALLFVALMIPDRYMRFASAKAITDFQTDLLSEFRCVKFGAFAATHSLYSERSAIDRDGNLFGADAGDFACCCAICARF
jgi:hypothetical protein